MYTNLINHLEESIKLLKLNRTLTEDELIYVDSLTEIVEKAKHWKPEIFLHIEGGNLQFVAANTNIVLNVFDADNEKEKSDYKDQREEWDYMLQTSIENKTLIQLMP